ncbi:unnamed protein product, partial [Mesorhabditis spiculigera]
MTSYITRAERSGSIFFRVTGLIRSGQLSWNDRPLWYDVYTAFPPLKSPSWDAKHEKHDEPVRKLMYKEDLIRAKFYRTYRQTAGVVNVISEQDSVSQQFINEWQAQKKQNPDSNDDQLFDKTTDALEAQGIALRK